MIRPTASSGGAAPDHHPHRLRMLALLGVAELLGMSLWFTASAVAPQLESAWRLTPGQVPWLTTIVQLGFVAGTAIAALLNLADVVPARAFFGICAVGGALVNAAVAVVSSFEAALVLRFLTGLFLAGVYPTAMKMVATWFRGSRGFAIGTIVGALTVGKATPYLMRAISIDYHHVLLIGSAAALLAAALVTGGYRSGPHPFAQRRFSLRLVSEVWRHRPTRLAISGYVGHMWELYAMWTWLPAFLLASAAATRAAGGSAPSEAVTSVLGFGAIAAGGAGCLWGGWAADRLGRARVVNLSMAVSGGCSLGVGLLFGVTPWLLVPLTWVWGFFVVADSAQFSAMVTEVAPAHGVGTALTLQTSVGFLLTMVTIEAIPVLVDLVTWRWAFAVLVLGPGFGIAAIRRWQRETGRR